MQGDGIKISVIIATYNGEMYLSKMLDSLLEQTLRDIEIICVDDGSTDNTVNIINDYVKKDDRIRLFYQQEDSKCAALARNLGIKKAKGKYVIFLDQDDYCKRSMLVKMYKRAEDTQSDIVVCNVYRYYEKDDTCEYINFIDKSIVKDTISFKAEDYKNDIFQIFSPAVFHKLYSRDFILTYDLKFRNIVCADDIEFSCISLCLAKKISLWNERLYYYRIHKDNNQTSMRSKYPQFGYKIFGFMCEEMKLRGIYDDYKVSFAKKMLAMVIHYLFGMDSLESFNILYDGFKQELCEGLNIDEIQDEQLDDENLCWFRKSIKASKDGNDFLFKWEKKYYRENSYSFNIPRTSNIDKGIIVYGASKFGDMLCRSINDDLELKVLGISDRKAEYLIKPSDLPKMDFSLIYIAVEDKKTKESIREDLISRGIPKDRIC